jgi:hypothetical protein
MRRPRALTAAVMLAAFALAAPGAPAAGVAEERPPANLTIAFTGDVSGYLEPCG